jgi:HD-like signal output (HDOD) protein
MRPDDGLLGDLIRIADDAAGSLDECRERLAAAPGVASEIVRVGNSELCGLPGRITRLDRAVHVLGARSVAEIATWLWVEDATRGGSERWQHALQVGVCGQLLARRLELDCDLEAGIAGLLHVAAPHMLERWQVRGRLRDAVDHHRDPLAAPAPSRSAAALVHGAHVLLRDGASEDDFLAGLGVLTEDRGFVLQATEMRCKQIRSVLG